MKNTKIKWRHRHSRHFLAHIGVLPAGSMSIIENPSHVLPHEPDLPEGTLMRSRPIWLITTGEADITRPDGTVHRVKAIFGGLTKHQAGAFRIQALDQDVTIVCMSPRRLNEWWERQIIQLRSGKTHIIPQSAEPQSVFVIKGQIAAGEALVGEHTYATIPENSEPKVIKAKSDCALVLLRRSGEFTHAVPAA